MKIRVWYSKWAVALYSATWRPMAKAAMMDESMDLKEGNSSSKLMDWDAILSVHCIILSTDEREDFEVIDKRKEKKKILTAN